MKKRKTIKIGDITHTEGKVFPIGQSLAITLPKSWAHEHDIQPGDVVVKVANSILTISTKGE
jgi:antitoxin component of MazEF toxin-antitoxin module